MWLVRQGKVWKYLRFQCLDSKPVVSFKVSGFSVYSRNQVPARTSITLPWGGLYSESNTFLLWHPGQKRIPVYNGKKQLQEAVPFLKLFTGAGLTPGQCHCIPWFPRIQALGAEQRALREHKQALITASQQHKYLGGSGACQV